MTPKERLLVASISAWMRATGWRRTKSTTGHNRGWSYEAPPGMATTDTDAAYEIDTDPVSPEFYSHGCWRYWPEGTTLIERIDLLVAHRVLPFSFSEAYRIGYIDGHKRVGSIIRRAAQT